MLVFDPNNPRSAEAAAAFAFGQLLAESLRFQELCEATSGVPADDKAKALSKIVIGYDSGPWEQGDYTEDELANELCYAHLITPEESSTFVVQDGFSQPLEGGDLVLTIRRYVRLSEQNDMSQSWLAYLDIVNAIEAELITAMNVKECPRLNSISRVIGPNYSTIGESVSQGEFLWSQHSINWGDSIE